MSLKNYIFSSVNTKGGQDSDKFATIRVKPKKKNNMANIPEEGNRSATLPAHQNAPASAPISNGNRGKSGDANTPYLKNMCRFWKYISVEPLILCWLLPSCFLFIAVENLALEKVSRSAYLQFVAKFVLKLWSFLSHVAWTSTYRMRCVTTWSTKVKTTSIAPSSAWKCAKRMWFTYWGIVRKFSTRRTIPTERVFSRTTTHLTRRLCSMWSHWSGTCAMPKSKVKNWTRNWMPLHLQSTPSSVSLWFCSPAAGVTNAENGSPACWSRCWVNWRVW